MSSDQLEQLQFEERPLRRVWDEETESWYFAVVDVIAALTDSNDPSKYWSAMKRREKEIELSTICRKFRLKAANGRSYMTDCADIKSMFRIIQSVPSPKAEPFKRWLAEVGEEKLEAESDPAKYIEMAMDAYRKLGYSEDWVKARVQKIISNEELIKEWIERGVIQNEVEALVDVIKKETFGLDTDEHKSFKGLQDESNLQDNMTRLELIFDMLGDEAALGVSQANDAKGMDANRDSAVVGGKVAGRALKDFERQTGKQVLSHKKQADLIEQKKEIDSAQKDEQS